MSSGNESLTFCDSNWCGKVMGSMRLLWQKQLLCDCTITANDGTLLLAHSVVLAASSPYMASLLQNGKPESYGVKLDNSSQAIQQLLSFVYTGRIYVETKQLLSEMSKLARELEMSSLLTWCCQMESKEECNSQHAFEAVCSSDEDSDGENGFPAVDEVKQETASETVIGSPEKCLTSDLSDNQNQSSEEKNIKSDTLEKAGSHGMARNSSPRDRLRRQATVAKSASTVGLDSDLEMNSALSSRRGRSCAKKERHACKICGKRLATRQSMEVHLRTHNGDRPFHCDLCDKDFTQSSSLQSHFRNVHQDERPYKCTQCTQSFKRMPHLTRHEQTIHATQTQYRPCKFCQKLFTREDSLKTHEKMHINPQSYTCEVCNKVFKQPSSLKDHALIHLGQATFACDICGGVYRTKRKLNSHKKIHDKNRERKFQCSYCAKQFFDKQSMHTHERAHTGDRPYKCKFCQKAFFQVSTRKDHELIHTGERPYVCEICGLDYIKISHLKRHKETHSEDKPYQCDKCEKSFKQERLLNTHLLIHSGELPKQCAICGKKFRTSGSLSTHTRSHTDARPYACRFCDRNFRKNQSRKAHEAKIHGQHNIPNSRTRETANQYVTAVRDTDRSLEGGLGSFSPEELYASSYSHDNIVGRMGPSTMDTYNIAQ